MTMLLAHSSFPIRQHSILVKKPCSCKKNATWNIPVGKAQSSLFVVSKYPFLLFWGTTSFIQYNTCALFLVNCFYHFAQGTSQK